MRSWVGVLLVGLFVFACKNENNKNSINAIGKQLQNKCQQKYTITPLGMKIQYLNQKGLFQVAWSNEKFKRTYDSSFSCIIDSSTGIWDFVPKFYCETPNYLVLKNTLWTSSGGNSAPIEFNAIVLPKNNFDSAFEKEFFIDCQNNYLISFSSTNDVISVLNLETKKEQLIALNPKLATYRSPTMSILKVKISNSNFGIKYEMLNKNDEIRIVDKVFLLNI
jgi:hypothetical protein